MTKVNQQDDLIERLESLALQIAETNERLADDITEAAEALQTLLVENERLREGLRKLIPHAASLDRGARSLVGMSGESKEITDARTLLGDSQP